MWVERRGGELRGYDEKVCGEGGESVMKTGLDGANFVIASCCSYVKTRTKCPTIDIIS